MTDHTPKLEVIGDVEISDEGISALAALLLSVVDSEGTDSKEATDQ